MGSPTHGHPGCATTAFRVFAEPAIEQTLQDRFEQTVALHRNCLALVDGDLRLTYGRLDAWANSVAHELVVASVRPGDRVAILADQGAGAVAGILGVLKAGAAYVPLDPKSSSRELRRTGETAQVSATVAAGAHLPAARVLSGEQVVDVGGHTSGVPVPPPVERASADLAYVYFTSGSTGPPKGVYDDHRNVLDNVLRYTNTLQIGPADRLSLVQAPTFSGTVSTLFAALCNGATLYPFPVGARGPAALAALVRDEGLTMLHSVPAIFQALARAGGPFPTVRVVRLEGDRATSRDVELFRATCPPQAVLVNGLGTTETGLVTQLFVDHTTPVEPGALPVGYPAPGVEVVILDGDCVPLPAGAIGEVGIVSRHLALGYWDDAARTSSRFVEIPPYGRTYRSGDTGRLQADGCLELHGRLGVALKVRGEQPDPAPAEAAILALDEVADAVVGVGERPGGGTQLMAWVVPSGGAGLSGRELRRYLAARLPRPHAPARVVVVDALPHTAHGKVDVRALAALPAEATGRPPAGALERRLARLWEDVLGFEPIAADESFFDLGGDSLAAAEILAAAELEAGRPLDAAALLEAPTIAQLAELVQSDGKELSPLVCMQRGSGRTLFFGHDLDGDLWDLQPLAAQLDCPVWGLRQPRADAAAWTLETHAALLCAAVRARQPVGPYRLGGHCFGAVLAFEAACQLVAAGDEVDLLLLLGISPWDFRILPHDVWRRYSRAAGTDSVAERAARVLADVSALGARRGVARLARAARSAPGYVRIVRGSRDRGHNENPDTDRNLRAFASYRPRPFPGTATLLLASETTVSYTDDPGAAWAALARDVVVHVLPGGDHDMLRPPDLSDTARIVRDAIAQTVP